MTTEKTLSDAEDITSHKSEVLHTRSAKADVEGAHPRREISWTQAAKHARAQS